VIDGRENGRNAWAGAGSRDDGADDKDSLLERSQRPRTAAPEVGSVS